MNMIPTTSGKNCFKLKSCTYLDIVVIQCIVEHNHF